MKEDFTDYYVYLMQRFREGEGWSEPNFVDVIAACRGWLPLEEGEVMNVHYGNKYYRIERLERSE